ncbi:unnamed protein product [Tuber aestivum]|uniref:Exocyst complex component Sec8 n=1 Tax=Tuber aestivum TaxID=59557 RepID=A0A292PVX6_9PEZI|nr:unnamed protein product [Tuber aestivum]
MDGYQRSRQGGGINNEYSGYGGYDYSDTRERPAYEERDRRRNERDQDRSGYAGYGGSDYGRDARQQLPPRSQQREPAPNNSEWMSDQQGYYGRDVNRGGNDQTPRGKPRQNGVKNYGPGTRRLEDILQLIEKDWDFMTLDSCVPVKVALQLMDTSSLGRAYQYDSYRQTHNQLQRALQSIVNDHHQGFNSSIGTFHSIMRSITTSQSKVRALRESLVQAKADLSTSKPEVKNMVETSQTYDTMLRTLNKIEQLNGVPEKLEARISEKRFLTAVGVLSDALKVINQPEMMEIGALSDLRTYLGSQESSLADILIEELHNHLYLKSPYCTDRWKPYSPHQKDLTNADISTIDLNEKQASIPSLLMKAGGKRPLHVFLDSADFTQPMIEDANANKNPEADSLYYIRLLLEALNSLGHISNAVGTVNQRLPVELFKLVEKTNNEVDQRHPSSLTGVARSVGKFIKALDLGLSDNDVRVTVIHDLLWTLYSKFVAVMEGHRVIYDVVKGISRRDGSQDVASLAGGFMEVWQLIQSEMRSLLHDYLTMADSRSVSSSPKGIHHAINNIVTGKTTRDKNKILFKLSSTDSSSASIKKDQDDLESILKASVPGLVSESLRPATTSSDINTSSDGAATGHKLLIEPSVFNMGLLLPPSLAFLSRIKDIVPAGSGIVLSTLTSFLDDFLVNVFHPSLEDTIRDLFNQTTSDLDAFQQDPQWASVANKPVIKGATAFFGLITALCKMLDTIPPDQAFGQLTIDLLNSYYEKCYEWYKELVARHRAAPEDGAAPMLDMKRSAQWARVENIHSAMGDLWTGDKEAEAIRKETEVELKEQEGKALTPADLITDRKVINSLCILYSSMKWLASNVVQLRHVEDTESFSRQEGGLSGRRKRRWTLISGESSMLLDETAKPIYLPMTAETAWEQPDKLTSSSGFDGVVNSFQELANTILFTLRAEARCHVLYYLGICMKEGNYCLDSPVNTPDSNILTLNADLVWFDEDISHLLRDKETKFLVKGLGAIIDHLLVANANYIRIINKEGVERMQLNILVLQQNLKNIETGGELVRASTFYALYAGGMENLIKTAKEGKIGFSYDDLKVLVELYFSEAMSNRRESASALQARRSLNENLLALSEIMWTL